MAKISEFIIKVSLNSGQLKALSGELGELCRQVKTSVSSVCASLNTIEAFALNPTDSIFQVTKKAVLSTTETIKQAEVDSQKTFGSIEIFEDSATGEGEFATHEKHLSYEDSGQGTEDFALTSSSIIRIASKAVTHSVLLSINYTATRAWVRISSVKRLKRLSLIKIMAIPPVGLKCSRRGLLSSSPSRLSAVIHSPLPERTRSLPMQVWLRKVSLPRRSRLTHRQLWAVTHAQRLLQSERTFQIRLSEANYIRNSSLQGILISGL